VAKTKHERKNINEKLSESVQESLSGTTVNVNLAMFQGTEPIILQEKLGEDNDWLRDANSSSTRNFWDPSKRLCIRRETISKVRTALSDHIDLPGAQG
jgi:hypothetical protein